jgi:hypothetical protein
MNQREINRVEKYLLAYPQLKDNAEALEALKALCVDPKIGYPANANNQRQFRSHRKVRDAAVLSLANSVKA